MNAGNGERRTVSGERHVGGRSGFKLATRLNAFNRNRLGEGYLGFGLRTPFWPVFFLCVCMRCALCVGRMMVLLRRRARHGVHVGRPIRRCCVGGVELYLIPDFDLGPEYSSTGDLGTVDRIG